MFQARWGKIGHCAKARAGEGVRLSDVRHRVYGEV